MSIALQMLRKWWKMARTAATHQTVLAPRGNPTLDVESSDSYCTTGLTQFIGDFNSMYRFHGHQQRRKYSNCDSSLQLVLFFGYVRKSH